MKFACDQKYSTYSHIIGSVNEWGSNISIKFYFFADCEEDGRKASNYVIAGAKSLAQHLKSWTQRKDVSITCSNYGFMLT